MLGAIIGDIAGSVYEFKNYRAKDFQPFFHPKAFFTDDTVCTVAVADALLSGAAMAATLRQWCRRYWDNGGWGQRFALWIADDEAGPYNSFGNGAGMRVSAAGMLAGSLDEAIRLANQASEVTHNHPEGMRGAAAIAVAIHLARSGKKADEIHQAINTQFAYDLTPDVDQIRAHNRHSERSQITVPQALICALKADDFEDAIRNAISIGGDSDTIAAMAGSVAESLFGIDDAMAMQTRALLPEDMQAVITRFYALISTPAS